MNLKKLLALTTIAFTLHLKAAVVVTNSTISQLPAIGNGLLKTNALIPVVQGGTNYNVTPLVLSNLIATAGGGGAGGTIIAGTNGISVITNSSSVWTISFLGNTNVISVTTTNGSGITLLTNSGVVTIIVNTNMFDLAGSITNAALRTNNLSDLKNTNASRIYTGSYGIGNATMAGNTISAFTTIGGTNPPGTGAGASPVRFAVYSDNYTGSTNSPVVNVHQGFATDPAGLFVWLSDTASLIRATNDTTWTTVLTNSSIFGSSGASHCGDIDYSPVSVNGSVQQSVLVAVLENYTPIPCMGDHQTIAVYDSTNLTMISSRDISGDGHECSGVCVVPEHGVIYVSSYCGNSVGIADNAIWRYDIKTLRTLSPIYLDSPCPFVQSIGYDQTTGLFYLVSAVTYIVDMNGHVISTNNVITTTSSPEGCDVKPGVIGVLDGTVPGGRVHFFTNNFSPNIIIKDSGVIRVAIGNPGSLTNRTDIYGNLNVGSVPINADGGFNVGTNEYLNVDNNVLVVDSAGSGRFGVMKRAALLPGLVFSSGGRFIVYKSDAANLITTAVNTQTPIEVFSVENNGVIFGNGGGLTNLNLTTITNGFIANNNGLGTNINAHGTLSQTNALFGNYIKFTQAGFIAYNAQSGSMVIMTNAALVFSNALGIQCVYTNGNETLQGILTAAGISVIGQTNSGPMVALSFEGNGGGLTNLHLAATDQNLTNIIVWGLGNSNAIRIFGSMLMSNSVTTDNVLYTNGTGNYRKTSLGTTVTPTLTLSNQSPATVGAQQVSPSLRLSGNGWGTTVPVSTNVQWDLYDLPIQGTVPTHTLNFVSTIGGAASTTPFIFNGSGALTALNWSVSAGGTAALATIGLGANGNLNWSGRAEFISPTATSIVATNPATSSSWAQLTSASVNTTTNNLSAPVSITVGASPFTYTNNNGANVTVYIGAGIVTAISLNGASLATGLTLTGLTTINLQQNETLVVTYSSTPTMNFKVF